jgi:hypothetical protein
MTAMRTVVMFLLLAASSVSWWLAASRVATDRRSARRWTAVSVAFGIVGLLVVKLDATDTTPPPTTVAEP